MEYQANKVLYTDSIKQFADKVNDLMQGVVDGGDSVPLDETRQLDVDLNTFTKSGVYAVGGTLTNAPNASLGTLFVTISDDIITQLFQASDNSMYFRQGHGSTFAWGAWTQLETTSGAQDKADTAESNAIGFAKSYGLGDYAQLLANGTDLDTLQKSGFYRVNAGVNVPPRVPNDNAGIWHYILVEGHDNMWSLQTAWEYNTGTMFTRVLNNGTWEPWTQLETKTDAENFATSLNTVSILDTRNDNQLPSWYNTNYGRKTVYEMKLQTSLGLNDGTYATLVTHSEWNDATGGSVKQVVFTESKEYIRYSDTANDTWGAWSEMATTSYVDTQVTNATVYGNKFEWQYNANTGTLDLVVLS